MKETIEEAAERYVKSDLKKTPLYGMFNDTFIEGAKWQQEQMYSEEDLKQFAEWLIKINFNYTSNITNVLLVWKEQFKKK